MVVISIVSLVCVVCAVCIYIYMHTLYVLFVVYVFICSCLLFCLLLEYRFTDGVERLVVFHVGLLGEALLGLNAQI